MFSSTLSQPSVLSSAQLSQLRVVVENSIGAWKDWRIVGSKYRHYRIDHDQEDRRRLGQVSRVIAALLNWRSRTSGKPRRRPGWAPKPNKEWLKKLTKEAEQLGGQQQRDFEALYNGTKSPAQLGLLGARLTEEQEKLLEERGDTSETWQIIEEVKGYVVLQNGAAELRIVKADSRAAASASLAPGATVTPRAAATSSRNWQYHDLDAPSK